MQLIFHYKIELLNILNSLGNRNIQPTLNFNNSNETLTESNREEIKNSVLLEKRKGNDIWRNLHQFPLIEMKNELTEEEKKYFASALRRRQLRLILAGKMKPDDATELKALFTA